MKLSILDQAPISSNQTPKDALYQSMKLAQAGEALGYTRFWIAEHHDLPGLACSAPEVMLSFIGAHTKTIRIGSGAILLPYYKPYKIAEIFNMLASLFPDRVDLGLGRAPGGPAEASQALSDQFLSQVWKMPELVEELLHFLNNDFQDIHLQKKAIASPLPDIAPQPWLLGTSKKSAILAAKNGMAYAFGQFMSEHDGKEVIQQYIDEFIPRKALIKPKAILTVSAFCAETTEKAENLALSNLIWALQREKGIHTGVPSIREAMQYELEDKDREKMKKMKENMIIGNPQQVKQKFEMLSTDYQIDEIMIVTITHALKDKINSYKLISKAIFD